MSVTHLALLSLLFTALVCAQRNRVASIPRQDTYLLPNGYTSDIELP